MQYQHTVQGYLRTANYFCKHGIEFGDAVLKVFSDYLARDDDLPTGPEHRGLLSCARIATGFSAGFL